MNAKRMLLCLMLLAVVAVGANVLLVCCGPKTRPSAHATPVDDSLEPTRITIVRPSEPRTVLAREGAWRLVEPYAASVDGQSVLKMLDKLLYCEIDDAMSDSDLLRLGRTRADFGLSDPVLRITLQGLRDSVDIAFGGYTPASNGVYAAVAGSASVLVLPAETFRAADRRAEEFRQRSVFGDSPESVRAFDIRRPAAPLLSFTRTGESWRAAEAPASTSKVKDFLACVTSARALDFVWPTGATNESQGVSAALLSGYGLDPESAVTIVLKVLDGADSRISLGGSAGEKRVYALVQKGSAIVTLDSALKDAALQDAALFTDSRLFPFESADVKSFTLSDAGTDYVIARNMSAAWRLELPVVADADTETAEKLLGRILSLSASDATPGDFRVSVMTNTQPISVSRAKILSGLRLEDLRSKDVLKADALRVKRLVSTPGRGGRKPVSVVYSRERRTWNLESGEERLTVSRKGIDRVLAALNPLHALRIVSLKASSAQLSEYELDEPFHTVAVDPDQEGAVRRNILIGGETRGGRYATIGSAEAVFVLSADTVKKLTAELVEE